MYHVKAIQSGELLLKTESLTLARERANEHKRITNGRNAEVLKIEVVWATTTLDEAMAESVPDNEPIMHIQV